MDQSKDSMTASPVREAARFKRADLGLAFQSLLYVGSGVNHLVHPSFYLSIMPDHYADPEFWVRWTGVAEILGGLGLVRPQTRRWAAAGLCLMLTGFFDVHVSMLQHRDRYPRIPVGLLWARLPVQVLLIAWAAQFLRSKAGEQTTETEEGGA